MSELSNGSYGILCNNLTDGILLCRRGKEEIWNLPGGLIPFGELPKENVVKKTYGLSTSPILNRFRLIAILGWDTILGVDLIYSHAVWKHPDVFELPTITESRFFSLQEIFLGQLSVPKHDKQIIGAWQKQRHNTNILEDRAENIKGVTIGMEFVSI